MRRPKFMRVVMLAVLSGTGAAAEPDERPSLSVTGIGRMSTAPDIAEVQVGVRTHAATAQQALAANNEAMNTLHGLLKERGVAAKDVQTTRIQVSPIYSQPRPRRPDDASDDFVPKVVGYRVDNTVQVTARQIARLGPLLDALVQGGANQIHGIAFRVEDSEKLLDDVRKRAMADAKRKAEILAGEAGVVVGLPRRISEESGIHPPRPPSVPMFAQANMMAAPAPMPIAAGEQELTVTVHVVYDLKPPG